MSVFLGNVGLLGLGTWMNTDQGFVCVCARMCESHREEHLVLGASLLMDVRESVSLHLGYSMLANAIP